MKTDEKVEHPLPAAFIEGSIAAVWTGMRGSGFVSALV
jgi:hypothetical protein